MVPIYHHVLQAVEHVLQAVLLAVAGAMVTPRDLFPSSLPSNYPCACLQENEWQGLKEVKVTQHKTAHHHANGHLFLLTDSYFDHLTKQRHHGRLDKLSWDEDELWVISTCMHQLRALHTPLKANLAIKILNHTKDSFLLTHTHKFSLKK